MFTICLQQEFGTSVEKYAKQAKVCQQSSGHAFTISRKKASNISIFRITFKLDIVRQYKGLPVTEGSEAALEGVGRAASLINQRNHCKDMTGI